MLFNFSWTNIYPIMLLLQILYIVKMQKCKIMKSVTACLWLKNIVAVPLFYKHCSTVCYLTHMTVVGAGAQTCSCKSTRALDRDRERWREQKKRRQRESSPQISECVWQRGQPRRQVPALQHRKWHMTALTFVIPCLPPPPNPSLQQTLRLAKRHTLKDTQSHTVYCLDYIIFIPRTWALLVGWHLGLCSTKVTFLCPWVKDACLQHAFEMKGRRGKKKIRWERFPKALWSEASTVTHKLVKQYVNLGWYWIKLPEWHESIVLRWSK